MCGIVGFSGDEEKSNLLSATKSLAHRGPDDEGTYYSKANRIGLGHTRLSIIDLSSLGHQPMLSEDESVILIFNGEIYNFESLKLKLKEIIGIEQDILDYGVGTWYCIPENTDSHGSGSTIEKIANGIYSKR